MTVIKRNGKTVEYNSDKIRNAISKAMYAAKEVPSKSVPEITRALEIMIKQKLIEQFGESGSVPVEKIQDIVETQLMQMLYFRTAKAYILYRDQHSKLREGLDVQKTIEGYIGTDKDWRVKENSTVSLSLGGLILSNSGTITANYWLNNIYDNEIAEAHRNADLHLHDLSMLSPYCFSGDTRIKTPDGTNPSFKELVSNSVQELDIYAYDLENKCTVRAKAYNPRMTRVTDEVVRIRLVSGAEIVCTTDHLFLTRSGEYVQAWDLWPETELQCMDGCYQRIAELSLEKLFTKIPMYDLTVPGYENFALDTDIFVHNCAGWSLRQLIEEGLGGVPGKISSSPAQHLSTLCNQMVNFLGILQNEWAG